MKMKVFAALLMAGALVCAPVAGAAETPAGGVIRSVSAAEITPRSDGVSVYVGGVALTSTGGAIVYATTDDSGNVSTTGATADNYNIKWDGSTLTLKCAKIKGDTSSGSLNATVGIYAFNSSGNVSLNIVLQDNNEITSDNYGIWVYSPNNGGNASLSIEGSGSLNASGFQNGIQVQSNSNNATLTIQNADVTATSAYSDGVRVLAGESSNASLSVEGGSLTATSGSSYGLGIYFYGPSSTENIDLTVSNNAIVRANGGIASGTNWDQAVTTGGTGIVFNGKVGTVYGSVTLQDDLTVGKDESLTLAENASLSAGGHNVIVDGGTLDNGLANSLGNSVIYKVTKVELNKTSLTLDVNESETLTATVTPDNATNKNVKWESSDTSVATVDVNGKVTAVAQGTATITVTAQDGSEEKATCSVTVNAAAAVPVESVSLTPSTLALEAGKSGTLTAAITPNNATNQAVTWTSSNTAVATVKNGVVTAVGAGEAIITVTTADGGKTDACKVTVTAVPEPEPEPEPEPTPEPEPEPEEPEEAYIPSTPIPDGFHEYSLGTMLYIDGKRVRGLYESEGATYFFNEQGFMQTGWVEFAEGWRYFAEDGRMVTGWLQIGNAWYYLAPETGIMFDDGLHTIGKSTYYFYDWGGMASDWWYEDEAGDWYFFGGSGAMKAAQWLEWKGDWYYLTESGRMAVDTEIGGYYVNASGVWAG